MNKLGCIVGLTLELICGQAGATQNEAVSDPVRIPRPWFHKNLSGKLTIQSPDLKSDLNLSRETPVSWIEEPTTLSAPLPGAIADYRDFRGCLNYEHINGVAVCFNVMPDVSSVGVNSREMQLQGIENFMTEELYTHTINDKCNYNFQNIKLIRASRDSDRVTVEFSGEAVPSNLCDLAKQDLRFRVELQAQD